MNIIVRAKGVELDDQSKRFLVENTRTALSRFEDRVMAVDVFVSDENGPKGGNDKTAVFRVRLTNGHLLTTETTKSDFYAAFAAGIKTTKRTVRRSIKKSAQLEKVSFRTLPVSPGLDI
ncbi:MAG: HPF/RaiA family ribosome-associated protein [Woeseiaceae bacterium]|nr:HPF/RaiA family ribosome-associated protein [Woeseiaceae bacterium]